MAVKTKKTTTQDKQHALSSPSHPKQSVEVSYPSDSSSSSSSSSNSARIYADDDSILSNNQQTQDQQSNSQITGSQNGNISSGAAALASSLNLRQADSNNSATSKRERDSDGISLKEYLRECYQSLTGESVNDELSSDEIFELLLSTSNEQYASDAEFKNRMAFLQRMFREEVDAPVPDVYGGKEFRSKGYPLLLTQSHIIVQICKRLRNNNSFDLIEWLQAIEFIQNIADLNCIAIKLGAGSGGFDAAKEFVNNYKSGGTIDDITSKQQEKATKKAEKLREERPKEPIVTFKKEDFTQEIPTIPFPIIQTIPVTMTNTKTHSLVEGNSITAKDPTQTTPTHQDPTINDEQIPLGGRLSHFHQNWKEFGVSETIADWIENGIPIDSDSSQWKHYHQRKFSQKEKTWITREIKSMLENQIIAHSKNAVLNPINVVPKKGTDEYRFILDLRKINDGITVDTFRMESIQKVMKFIRKGMWACKLDLKKGYFQVPVRNQHKVLLGFVFEGKTYHFQCLPFGLSTAPRLFTKIMKEVIKKWRQKGVIIFIYIDDMLILGNSAEEVLEKLQTILLDLNFLGWLVQEEKSILIPTQSIDFLGLHFDLVNGKVQIPLDKQQIALDIMDQLISGELQRTFFQTRFIAKFIGKMEFLALADPAIRPFLDRLRKQMVARVDSKGWNSTMLVNRGPAKDLRVLRKRIQFSKGSWLDLEAPEPIIINSDASLEGFAIHSSKTIVVGKFEMKSSINVKELFAILQFFKEASRLKLFPKNTHFEIRGDNSTALSYVTKGYGFLNHLSEIAREIWKILIKEDWYISKVVYIPSKENKIADRLSRLGDWKSSQELIDLVEEEFGHHTVDRFAAQNPQ